jgi:hypothetical protein
MLTVHDVDLARFPAIRAVIQSVAAKANAVLSHANTAIAFAPAVFLGLLAHGTDCRFHLMPTIGNAAAGHKKAIRGLRTNSKPRPTAGWLAATLDSV